MSKYLGSQTSSVECLVVSKLPLLINNAVLNTLIYKICICLWFFLRCTGQILDQMLYTFDAYHVQASRLPASSYLCSAMCANVILPAELFNADFTTCPAFLEHWEVLSAKPVFCDSLCFSYSGPSVTCVPKPVDRHSEVWPQHPCSTWEPAPGSACPGSGAGAMQAPSAPPGNLLQGLCVQGLELVLCRSLQVFVCYLICTARNHCCQISVTNLVS